MLTNDLQNLAVEIVDAIDLNRDFAAAAERFNGNVEHAYQVQLAVVDALAARHGTTLGGRKVGFNSAAQMAHLGLDTPPTGHVRSDQIKRGDAANDHTVTIDGREYHSFGYECEIAVVLGAAFEARDQPYAPADLTAAIDWIQPAFEIVDTRGVAILEADATDIIGNNIFNAGIVLGGPGAKLADVDLDSLVVSITEGDETVLSTTGGTAQTPTDAAMTMVNAETTRGRSVDAGTVLICGAYLPPRPAANTRVTFSIDQLGSVSMDVDG